MPTKRGDGDGGGRRPRVVVREAIVKEDGNGVVSHAGLAHVRQEGRVHDGHFVTTHDWYIERHI